MHFDGLNVGKGKGSVLRNCKSTGGYDTLKLNENSQGVTVEHNEFYGTVRHLPVSLTGARGLVFRGNLGHDWTPAATAPSSSRAARTTSCSRTIVFEDVHTAGGTIAMGDGCDSTCDIDPQHYAAVRVHVDQQPPRARRPWLRRPGLQGLRDPRQHDRRQRRGQRASSS